jgi:hydroxylamine reductase
MSLNGLKDLFFGNDEEREETNMGNTENNAEGALVDASMLVGDIISKHPLAAQFLMECGMGCISCPASQMESLAEACAVHGIDGEEITDALNDYLLEHNA